MVVTRKKPSVPAQPASRTNSTQALPRAVNAKPKHPNLPIAPEVHSNSSQSSSRDAPNDAVKSKSKPPQAPREKRSILDRLFLLFLATFAAYTLYTCPYDITHENSLCHSLATYRTHVLEPYVIPPVRAVISHPTIVEPYNKYAKPIYQTYVQPITPYLASAQRRTAPYLNTVIAFSGRASSRLWNNVLGVYWTRAVVPRYTLYVQPRVDKYVSPIVKRAKYYKRRAEPYVRALAHHTSAYARRAQKHAFGTYNWLQPHGVKVYMATKPHVLRAYGQVKPSVGRAMNVALSKGNYLISEAILLSQVALGRVGDLRREFVDPHVLRIWEKAVEKSGPSSTESIPPTTSATPTQSEVPASFGDISTPAHITSPSLTTIIEFVPSPSAAPDFLTSEVPSAPDAPSESIAAHTPEATLEKAVSVAEASAAHASDVIGEMEREIKRSEAVQVPLTPTPDPAEAQEPTPAEIHEAEQAVPSQTPVVQEVFAEQLPVPSFDEGEDLDDFLKEIGLAENEEVPEPEPEPEAVPLAPTEEDEEAKRAATAAKRVKIVGRHTRWQSELDSLAKDMEERVKREVKVIRDEAITHVGRFPSNGESPANDGKGKEVIDKVQNDGEKLLKGLEAYVKKLMTRAITPEDQEKEKETWAKVVEKVEGRFKDVVRNIQEEVHNWYVSVREREIEAALVAAKEVKSLAEEAQADLGLDYAWLDDVTYGDWQNYHDLMRTYDRFDQTARSLQNGTHTDAPEDNLIPVLNDLDREVQDMISGFAMRMNTLVRDGDRWLAGLEPLPEPELETEDTEEEECEEEEYEEEEEPQMSILPISPERPAQKIQPEQILMEKSPQQIEKMAQQAIINERTEL